MRILREDWAKTAGGPLTTGSAWLCMKCECKQSGSGHASSQWGWNMQMLAFLLCISGVGVYKNIVSRLLQTLSYFAYRIINKYFHGFHCWSYISWQRHTEGIWILLSNAKIILNYWAHTNYILIIFNICDNSFNSKH